MDNWERVGRRGQFTMNRPLRSLAYSYCIFIGPRKGPIATVHHRCGPIMNFNEQSRYCHPFASPSLRSRASARAGSERSEGSADRERPFPFASSGLRLTALRVTKHDRCCLLKFIIGDGHDESAPTLACLQLLHIYQPRERPHSDSSSSLRPINRRWAR